MHPVDPPVMQWLLAAACVAAALWAGFRLTAPQLAFRTTGTTGVTPLLGGYLCRGSEAAEAAMLAAMAAMFVYPAAPHALWWTALAGIGLALAAQLTITRLRSGGLPGGYLAASGYHLLAVAVMAYAMVSHAGPPLLGWAFLIVFATDALMVTGVVLAPPAGLRIPRSRLAAATLPHVVMDVAMIAMLYPTLTGGMAH